MKSADYSQVLTQSSVDHCWKTAHDVKPPEFPQVTRRLRYQAGQLGLEISILTDKQNRTVSFLSWETGTCPAHGQSCPYLRAKQVPRCQISGIPGASTTATIVVTGALLLMVCFVSTVSTGSISTEECRTVMKEGRNERSGGKNPSFATQRLRRLVLRSYRRNSMGCARRGRRTADRRVQTRLQIPQATGRVLLDVPNRSPLRSNT